MALQVYTKAVVYIQGSQLTEETSVTVRRMGNHQIQETVAKGFSGMSPGAPRLEISISNATPSADFELNAGQFIRDLEVVEITVYAAGRSLTTKGFITEDNFSHATNTASKLDMTAVCEFVDWV